MANRIRKGLKQAILSKNRRQDVEPVRNADENFDMNENQDFEIEDQHEAVETEPEVIFSSEAFMAIAISIQQQFDYYVACIDMAKGLPESDERNRLIDVVLSVIESQHESQINQILSEPDALDVYSTLPILTNAIQNYFLVPTHLLGLVKYLNRLHENELPLPPDYIVTNLKPQLEVILGSFNQQSEQEHIKSALLTLNWYQHIKLRLNIIDSVGFLTTKQVTEEILTPILDENSTMTTLVNHTIPILSSDHIHHLISELNLISEQAFRLTQIKLIFMASTNVNNQALLEYKELNDGISLKIKNLTDLQIISDALNENQSDSAHMQMYQAITSLQDQLYWLGDLLNETHTDDTHLTSIASLRLARGDFFTNESKEILEDMIYSFFCNIKFKHLLTNILDQFFNYDLSKQINCIKFLIQFLMLDTEYTLISSKYEKSEVIDKLNLLNHIIISKQHDETLIDQLNTLSSIIIDKVIHKDQLVHHHLKAIEAGQVPKHELLSRLNSINHKYMEYVFDEGIIQEFTEEVIAILQSPLLQVSHDQHFYHHLLDAANTFELNLASLTLYDDLAKAVQETIHHISNKNESKLSTRSVYAPSQHNILHMISEISHDLNAADKETLVQNTYQLFYNGFALRYERIHFSELDNCQWEKDEERIKTQLMIRAPNIRRHKQYANLVSKFILISVLYDVEKGGNFSAREKSRTLNQIQEFFLDVAQKALGHKNSLIAKTILDSLSSPFLVRLQTTDIQQNIARQLERLENLKPTSNALQHFLEQCKSITNKTFKNETERYVHIGHLLKKFVSSKTNMQNSFDDGTHEMFQSVQQLDSLHQSLFYQDIIVNERKINDAFKAASFQIKPTVNVDRSVFDFTSIHEIKSYLQLCIDREMDYHFAESSPMKGLIQHLGELIADDAGLNGYEDVFTILELLTSIEKSHHRNFDDRNGLVLVILDGYYRQLSTLDQDELVNISHNVQAMLKLILSHPFVEDIRAQVRGYQLTKQSKDLKNVVGAFDQFYLRFKQEISIAQEEKRQQTYSELLTKVLEGTTRERVIPFKQNTESHFQADITLLPESEFPVPIAEPEHPDYIGINKTMNFNPVPLPTSVLSIFSTKELIQDFIDSFTWSTTTRNIRVLEQAIFDPATNLLGLDQLYPAEVQIAVMNLVLVSMDTIGKISGFNGNFAIHNFTAIKEINTRLGETASMLSSNLLDNETIILRTQRLFTAVHNLNEECIVLLKKSHRYPLDINTYMSEFCHLNEHLMHRLLGIPYQKSVLSPLAPNSSYYTSLSDYLKRELPTNMIDNNLLGVANLSSDPNLHSG